MKILIIDDHALVLEGLRQVLSGLAEQPTVITAPSAQQALQLIVRNRDLDLAIVDYHLPDMTGLEMLQALAKRAPDLPVLMLSGMANTHLMQQVLDAGAVGFVSKASLTSDLLDAVRTVLEGNVYTPPELQLARTTPGPSTVPRRLSLSPHQERVLRELLNGSVNRVIAEKLGIGEETVKSHVSAILRYFGVHTRTQAVLAAAQYGFRPGI